MEKAAILTINDYNNYGNRLQNYAVQEILIKHGFQVETIIHELDYKVLSKKYNNNNLITKIQSFISSNKKIEMLKTKLLKKQETNLLLNERITNFKKFTKENIFETEFTISENRIPEGLGNQYDYFFTGSDQVWNPNFRIGSTIDFLTFAPKEKRFALSASIGVSTIPEKFKADYKKYLNGFNRISVREHQGSKLVKELSGRESEVLIDPTLYLSKEEWLDISKPHVNKPIGKYLLTYFLGEIPSEYQKFIDEYVQKRQLEIVNLADPKVERFYMADPANFIDYIYSAHAFFTDSYHGIIFSILMETPFLIFERIDGTPKMNSRLDTLRSTFEITEDYFFVNEKSTPLNYSTGNLMEIINVQHKKMQIFIKNIKLHKKKSLTRGYKRMKL